MDREIFSRIPASLPLAAAGWDAFEIPVEEWIELPDGGSLYELPGRRGIGMDTSNGEMRLCEKGWAVAAFIPPAHTGFISQPMKPPPVPLPFPCSVIPQPVGSTKNSLFRLCALNRISARKPPDMMIGIISSGVEGILSCLSP